MKFLCIVFLSVVFVYAFEPAIVHLEPMPKLTGDEFIPGQGIPYLGIGRQSPGDQIGTTWYDFQAHCGGSHGQRLFVDSYNQTHICWMKRNAAGDLRYCAWNFRYANGTYYGETQASPSWSGYAQIDVIRDGTEKSVITFHYDAGFGFYSWIDIDAGNGWGNWPNDPNPLGIDGHYEGNIAVASNNNIVLACHTIYSPYRHHLYLTTDLGDSWIHLMEFDSVATASHFVRASRNSGSHKVVFAHTQFITDTNYVGCIDSDIWYVLSTADGVTWEEPVNVTNYQPYPIDSVRANDDLCAIFDLNDKLHIVWTGLRVTDTYFWVTKIFHWDEVNDTITVVSADNQNFPGGWWGWKDSISYGGSRWPADQPQLIINPNNGWLYCLWHGNTDTTDISANGWPNGELYGAFSTDNGITWSDYVNLTNTTSPGAVPGHCYDEDYMTANPFLINDSIYITYMEDKDAGAWVMGEGVATENPVRCWVFHRELITGITEDQSQKPEYSKPMLEIYPNPFSKLTAISFSDGRSAYGVERMELNIYDITGRCVKSYKLPTAYSPGLASRSGAGLLTTNIKWNGEDEHGRKLPAGVYFVRLESGNYTEIKKAILLK